MVGVGSLHPRPQPQTLAPKTLLLLQVVESVLGRNCRIGKDAQIRGSYLHDDVTVGDNAQIDSALLCQGAVVQEDAVVMAGAIVSFKVGGAWLGEAACLVLAAMSSSAAAWPSLCGLQPGCSALSCPTSATWGCTGPLRHACMPASLHVRFARSQLAPACAHLAVHSQASTQQREIARQPAPVAGVRHNPCTAAAAGLSQGSFPSPGHAFFLHTVSAEQTGPQSPEACCAS